MKELNHTSTLEGYILKDSMSFKKGAYAIFANIFILFATVIGAVTMVMIFDYDSVSTADTLGFLIMLLYKLVPFLIILMAFLLMSMVLQIVFLKAGGGGKIKLHVGLIVELYSENAIKRKPYFFAQLFSGLIPLVILAVLTIFLWADYTFISLIMIASNFLAYIPAFIFILRQGEDDLFKFESGMLNVFTQPAEIPHI